MYKWHSANAETEPEQDEVTQGDRRKKVTKCKVRVMALERIFILSRWQEKGREHYRKAQGEKKTEEEITEYMRDGMKISDRKNRGKDGKKKKFGKPKPI